MRFFRKPRPANHVLNLFRITDVPYARGFDGVDLLALVESEVAKLTDRSPTRYHANYVKEWASQDGFMSGARQLPELVLALFTYDEPGLLCEYQNTLLDMHSVPEVGSISLVVSVPERLATLEQLLDLAKTIYSRLPFEYGYGHLLGGDYLPGSEVKIERTLFGNRNARVEQSGSIWRYHMIGIRHGFLRNVYELNILNDSQRSNPTINSLLERGVGTIRQFNENLFVWSIAAASLSSTRETLASAGSLIGHEAGRAVFLQQACAKEFYAAMAPKAGV